MVGASGPEIQNAKAIIGDEVREMLRLTRQLLRPSNEVDAAAKQLDAVMNPLALKIRESEKPEAMRAAIDEIILEELKARYEDTRKSDQS
jgi:transcriptional regulator NrdR family protein